MNKKWLAIAREAMSQNDLARARGLLRAYVARHPTDEDGWHWLSRVAAHPAEENLCLRRLLDIKSAKLTRQGPVAAPIDKHTRSPVAKHRVSPSYKIIRTTISAAVCSLTAVVFFILITALAPMFMGYRTLVILSGSMAPTIAMGSVSIAEPVPSNSLAVGQAIAYAPSPNAQVPIVHRIVNIRQKDGVRYYTTQGDANPAADAEISLPPTAWRVWYSVPMAGYIIAYATSPAGNLLLIVIPLICLGVLKITDWLKANAPMRLPWINSKHSTMI